MIIDRAELRARFASEILATLAKLIERYAREAGLPPEEAAQELLADTLANLVRAQSGGTPPARA